MSRTVVRRVAENLIKKKILFSKIAFPAFLVLFGIFVLIEASSVSAATITWAGNGTTNGLCDSLMTDTSTTGQTWLFILTSPDNSGTYQLTTSFSPSAQSPSSPITGTQQGNGSIHFFVTTSIGAQLLSASATGGTDNSNLVVSHCTVGKYSPTISTVASAGGVIGVVLNDTATLSNASPSPTGSVTFSLFPPSDSTCANTPVYTETDSTAPYATTTGFTTNAVGVWHWTAHYSGDTNNNPADSPCTAEAVTTTKATPGISTTASQGGIVGIAINDSATVTGGYSPTGSVTFYLFGPNDDCSNLATALSTQTEPLTAGAAGPTTNYTTTTVGTFHWEAVYSGDANNNSVASKCTDEAVTTTKATPSIKTTASGPVVTGNVITDTAHLTGGYGTLAGSVTFDVFAPGDTSCTTPISVPPSKSVNGVGDYTSGNYTTTVVGDYRWEAHYSGDSNNNAVDTSCNDANETSTVIKASPDIATTASAGGVVGIKIHDSANVTGGYNPTGSVTFYLFGPNDECSDTGNAIFTETDTLKAGAAGPTADYATAAVGTFHWEAVYSGDGSNNSATSDCTEEAVTVIKATPSISTTASQGGVVGVDINDSANVTGGFSPTGTVTFYLFGPNDNCSNLSSALFTATDPLSAGTAGPTANYSTTTVGTFHWEAIYNGDANNNSVSSSCSDEAVTVIKATPTLKTTASGPVVVGNTISDTAHLTGGYGTLAGSITFDVFAPGDTSCTTPIGVPPSVSVSGTGDYTSGNYTTTAVGDYRWEAHYTGDANNNAVDTSCNDANETSTVTKASPGINTTASAGGVIGIKIHDSASVTGGYNPTGSVTFYLFGPNDNCSNLATALLKETDTLSSGSAGPTADYTTSAIGTYHWEAVYGGDNNNNGATSSCAEEAVVVTKATPTIATTASAGGVVGIAINDSANVTGGSSPTGSVTFYLFGPSDNCSNLNTALLTETDPLNGASAGPTGNYTTTTVGTYHWKAVYSGDANNNSVTSPCSAEAVTTTKASPAVNTVPSTGGIVGIKLNDTATVTGGYKPTGSVTFSLFPPSDSTCANTPVYTETDSTAPYATTTGFTTNAVGVWHWTAHYSGDTNNNPADSPCTAEAVTTTKATPGISTTASAGGLIGIVIHDAGTLTGGYNLTGTITFKLYSPSDPTCTNTPIFTNSVNVSGAGTYTGTGFTTNAAGTWRWVAVYSGDTNNNSVTSGCNDEQVTITQVLYWCSPGFWATAIKQNRTGVLSYLLVHGVNLNATYSTIPASLKPAKLKNGNPNSVTLSQVLSSPSTYGGQAFNSVADYIANQLGWQGNQNTGEQCPLDAHGVFTPIV